MKPTVFVQANRRQMFGARISAFSFRRRSRSPDDFNVRIVDIADFPLLADRGHSVLRDGFVRTWDPDDLQSFTPLRFAPPKLMGFEGRAVVVDPDCFAVGDTSQSDFAIEHVSFFVLLCVRGDGERQAERS